jgi:hypothetical protein
MRGMMLECLVARKGEASTWVLLVENGAIHETVLPTWLKVCRQPSLMVFVLTS